MKTVLLFIFLLLPAAGAFAQTDSLKVRRHELGLDFLPLLQPEREASLLYRNHTGNAAWRVRFQGSFNQAGPGKYTEEFSRSANVSGRLGREWHYDFNKFRFYYGLDLSASYFSMHRSVQRPEWMETRSRNLEFSINPLLGFGYKFNERFTLSAEGNGCFFAGRQWQSYWQNWDTPNTYIGFNTFSEFALFLSYRF